VSPTLRRLCPSCRRTPITTGRRCPDCEARYQQALAARRGTTAQRGYGSAHRAWAAQVLALHPVCPCGAPATVADHVVAFRDSGAKYDVRNGQGLCLTCSGRKDGGIRR
jgi:hypothetical protein